MILDRAKTFLAAGLLALSVAALAGCAGYYDGGDGYDHRGRYDYYYYPGSDVYFQPYSGLYYYRDNGRWKSSRDLPRKYYLDRRDRRYFTSRDKEPYDHHDEHMRTYRPAPDYNRDRQRDDDERRYNRSPQSRDDDRDRRRDQDQYQRNQDQHQRDQDQRRRDQDQRPPYRPPSSIYCGRGGPDCSE